jgi:uncharacterized protein (TIGR00369 family)
MNHPIRELVERVTYAPGYTSAVGTRVESAEPGYVVMSLAKTDNLLQANGFFHGGVIAGLADHAGGGAVTTAMPPGRFAVTVNLQVSFLAPANGGSLIAGRRGGDGMRGRDRDASRRRLPGPIKATQCWRVRRVPTTERRVAF